jgi:hypothetical protein
MVGKIFGYIPRSQNDVTDHRAPKLATAGPTDFRDFGGEEQKAKQIF